MKKVLFLGMVTGLFGALLIVSPLWIPFYILFWACGSYLIIKFLAWIIRL